MLKQITQTLHKPNNDYIQQIIDIHLDSKFGTPYWLQREKDLRVNVKKEVKSLDDFRNVFAFKTKKEQTKYENDLRKISLDNFIPLKIRQDKTRRIWFSQTGGTTGLPKHGCWDNKYWKQVLDFTDEFLDIHQVPYGGNWLFMGPMGPHTTGRLVVTIAENRGGGCFTIDLDPRFVKIAQKENGLGNTSERYIQHIWDQAVSILKYQKVEVLFATSRLLEMAPEYIDLDLFKNVKAIVHAGTSLNAETNQLIREELFPNSRLIGMYGTSTTGISYQSLDLLSRPYEVVYIPSNPFIHIEVVDENGDLVNYGESGHLSTYRFTEDYLIPGFWERDKGVRILPEGSLADRYPWDWVGNIYSPVFTNMGGNQEVEGVY